MGRDIYFTIENGRLVEHIENDGYAFIKSGAEATSRPVSLALYSKDARVLRVIDDWEKRNNKKFEELTLKDEV